MGTGKGLSQGEQGKIAALSFAGWTDSKISQRLNKRTIVNLKKLRNAEAYGTARARG